MFNEISNQGYVVVIGGANMDIGGRPYKPLIEADSNPGIIRTGLGGVGRNIAHNLTKLGVKTYLITALGNDYVGTHILKNCEDAGIDMSHSLILPGESSSMYLFINDSEGEMSVAISHMEIVKNIDPDYIDTKADLINSASAVVVDCNLSQETLLHILKICEVHVYADTVSTSHAEKIKGHLEGIYALKPNRLEAEYLTGMTIMTDGDYKAAAAEMLRQGVEKVFISMGPRGMFAADKDHSYIVDRFPADVVSTTGAGDSATAGIVWASDKDDILYAAAAANAAASLTLTSSQTVIPDISAKRVSEMIEDHDFKVIEI